MFIGIAISLVGQLAGQLRDDRNYLATESSDRLDAENGDNLITEN